MMVLWQDHLEFHSNSILGTRIIAVAAEICYLFISPPGDDLIIMMIDRPSAAAVQHKPADGECGQKFICRGSLIRDRNSCSLTTASNSTTNDLIRELLGEGGAYVDGDWGRG